MDMIHRNIKDKSKAAYHSWEWMQVIQCPAKYSKKAMCVNVRERDDTMACILCYISWWWRTYFLLHFALCVCVPHSWPMCSVTAWCVVCVCEFVCVCDVCFVAMETFSVLFFSAEVWGDATEAGDVISQLWTSHAQTHEVSRKRQIRHVAHITENV